MYMLGLYFGSHHFEFRYLGGGVQKKMNIFVDMKIFVDLGYAKEWFVIYRHEGIV